MMQTVSWSHSRLPLASAVTADPFHPATSVSFTVPEPSRDRGIVCNMIGQMVKELVNGMIGTGNHTVSFDASTLPSGVYLYRLEAISLQ